MTGILDARVPLRLLDGGFADVGERMARVDIAIADGKFAAVRPAGTRLPHGDAVAQDGAQVWLGLRRRAHGCRYGGPSASRSS